MLWVGGVNVEGGGGNYFFKVDGGGDKAFFQVKEGGGEGFFKVETKVPEEDFSSSIAWSLTRLIFKLEARNFACK